MRLRRLSFASALPLLVGSLVVAPEISSARGVDQSLCDHQGARVSVASDFFLDACFDGTTLTLLNRSDLVIDANPSGQWSVADTFTENAPPAAIAVGAFVSGSTVLAPGHGVRLAIGAGSVDVSLQLSGLNDRYGIASAMYDFLPGLPPTIAAYDAGVDFYYEIEAVASEFNKCLGRNNFVGDIGCSANLNWDINFAVGRLAKTIGVEVVKIIAGPVAGLVEVGLWTRRTLADSGVFYSSARSLSVASTSNQEASPPDEEPVPGTALAPTISSFDVSISGSTAQIAGRIGWSEGTDPVVCTIWVDDVVVLEQGCGTAPSLKTEGLSAGQHELPSDAGLQQPKRVCQHKQSVALGGCFASNSCTDYRSACTDYRSACTDHRPACTDHRPACTDHHSTSSGASDLVV